MRIRGLVVLLAIVGLVSITAALEADCMQAAGKIAKQQGCIAVARHRSDDQLMRRSPVVRMILHHEVLGLPDNLKELIKRLGNG